MTEDPAHCLEILGMSFEVKLGGELPEQMHMHFDPSLAQHKLRDMVGKGLGVPASTAITGEQPWCRAWGHAELVVLEIQRQEFGSLLWQCQLERLRVFDLLTRDD